VILNEKTNNDKNLHSEKNDLKESYSLDKEQIKKDIDIDAKLKNYNKNVNYNSFNEGKNLVLETIKNRKIRLHERNNSLNNFNISIRNDDTIINDKSCLDSPNSLHRKYSLEKRIRDFKKKISKDLNDNSNIHNLKRGESIQIYYKNILFLTSFNI